MIILNWKPVHKIWDPHCKLFLSQIEPVALNGRFRAFKPHAQCNDPELTLAHYVKDIYQREFMENYKREGRFCNEEHIKQWDIDHPKKPKKPKKKNWLADQLNLCWCPVLVRVDGVSNYFWLWGSVLRKQWRREHEPLVVWFNCSTILTLP